MVFWGIFFMDSFNSYFIRMMVLGLKRIKKGEKIIKTFHRGKQLEKNHILWEKEKIIVYFF